MSRLVHLALVSLSLVSTIPPGAAHGAEPRTVEPVVVIGVSPLPGSGVDIDKTPSGVASLSAADLSRGAQASVAGTLAERLSSISLGDNLDNPFQPDVLLRGFEASPVLGTPQGVAVYQNGARINEAFGETVNWDLIPDIAIRRLDVLGANPVFGLNALGGAIVVAMKTGFTDPGGDASVSGGAFGRREAKAEFGANSGVFAAYVAARTLDEDGWRAFSANRLRQLYADLGARQGPLGVDLAVSLADNHLRGESAAPVQELAVNRALIFTHPQQNDNRLTFITLNGSYSASPTLSFQAAAYYRGFRQYVLNGNTSGYVACVDGPDLGFLCQGDAAAPLHDASGRRIADLTHGGAVAVGVNDREHIRSDGAGGSLQATSSARLWGRPNHLTVGGSLDAAWTRFASDGEVGPIDAALRVVSTGLFISTPEDTGFTAMPVALRARSTYAGLYVTDTLDVTDRASITASGRYDHARIDLTDRLGDNLNGRNRYQRFNPALGATWRLGRALTAYGGYAEGSRVPNPSEIECSNPLIPCLLPSSLASDPPTLRQVVAVTWEAGLRGRAPFAHGTLTWTAGWYRTEVHDDIQAVATSLSAGYFQNIGGTSREGVELGARYVGARLSAFVSYSHVEADYRTGFVLPSPSHPLRDAAGLIVVRPGDRLPGIPRDRLKLGVEIEPRAGWTLGVNFNLVGDQAYRGDESNQLAPLPAYAVVNLHTSLNLTRNFSLFATVDNVLDAHYATFGLLGDPTGVGAPGVPDSAADPRFQSPAAPISAYGGVRVQF